MQTNTVPFVIDDTPHRIRVEIKGLRHSIYLDDHLYFCHNAKPANGCAVYVIPLDGVKIELLLQQQPAEWTVDAYLDDRAVNPTDELPLSKRLDFLATASDISFGEHCSRVWKPTVLRWAIWLVACVLIFSIAGGGKAILWAASAGLGLIAVTAAILLDFRSTYQQVRKFRTPEDCYQHPERTDTIL